MKGDYGMAFAGDGRSMADGGWKYDSRLKKWTIDVKATPPHLDVFELDGGTQWTRDIATPATVEETIFKIKHNMPFPPKFMCYFYCIDAPVGWTGMIGAYTLNRAYMMFNDIFHGEERLYAKVDDEYFYIKHVWDILGAGSGNYTCLGNGYNFRVRYELLGLKAYYLGVKN